MPLIKTLRLSHWTKNLFLFLPLFFSGHVGYIDSLLLCLSGFLAFGLSASGIYIINDVKDVEEDRLHPIKKNRPFASGQISVSLGIAMAIMLLGSGLVIAAVLNPLFLYVLLAYVGMNLAYSMGLKHMPIIDVSMIATGFVLRVVSGGLLAEVAVSHWIIVMTFLLALFLGLAKRRDDLIIYRDSGKVMRKSMEGYNLEFINAAMTLMAGVIVVAYLMYTLSDEVIQRMGTEQLYLTGLFVIMGLMRYLQITLVFERSGNPTQILLRDRTIQLVLMGWMLSFVVVLYSGQLIGR
jgi:decaprenyl-phosphate phosphoribosyltransferase